MKNLLHLLWIVTIALTGCGKKENEVIFPQTSTVQGTYNQAVYDTTFNYVSEQYDTLANITGTLVRYSSDSMKITIDGPTGTRLGEWQGKTSSDGHYYREFHNYDSGAVRHHHYAIVLEEDKITYHYHARTGEGTRYGSGGEITYETTRHYEGAIERK